MLNKEGIRNLYKAKTPAGGYPDSFLHSICEKCKDYHQIEFNDGYMTIGSLDSCNPFKRIKLSCIKSIHDLGDEVAVVLNSCIIIFNNVTGKININIRTPQEKAKCCFIDRILSIFRFGKAKHLES